MENTFNYNSFEKIQEYKELAKDCVELKEIMHDVNKLIADNAEQLALIDNKIENANENIVAGNKQIITASNINNKTNKLLKSLVVMGVGVAGSSVGGLVSGYFIGNYLIGGITGFCLGSGVFSGLTVLVNI
tara:strand:- start:99 stop:491 length:393 start_codon:yes stop_codon:yes gene_type:complete